MTILGMGLIFLLMTWWAIWDLAYKDFDSIGQKALWAFIALIPFIGCVVYFLIGRKKGLKRKNK
ncbi:Cardiolipin synthase N-terminal domain-containing protein [Candidatus Magnetomoraceae bacterium gMMP-15]